MPTESNQHIDYSSFYPKDFREVYEAGSDTDFASFYFRRSAFTN